MTRRRDEDQKKRFSQVYGGFNVTSATRSSTNTTSQSNTHTAHIQNLTNTKFSLITITLQQKSRTLIFQSRVYDSAKSGLSLCKKRKLLPQWIHCRSRSVKEQLLQRQCSFMLGDDPSIHGLMIWANAKMNSSKAFLHLLICWIPNAYGPVTRARINSLTTQNGNKCI